MKKIYSRKPVAVALGAAIASSVTFSSIAIADENPFGATQLSNGYMVAFSSRKDEEAEGKCGAGKSHEGNCGEGKGAEGHCGEGKSGEGSCGESKTSEGSCGEGKCGANK